MNSQQVIDGIKVEVSYRGQPITLSAHDLWKLRIGGALTPKVYAVLALISDKELINREGLDVDSFIERWAIGTDNPEKPILLKPEQVLAAAQSLEKAECASIKEVCAIQMSIDF